MNLAPIILLLVFAQKEVEYRFGINYGKRIFDFSLNKRHTSIPPSSNIKSTDRGLYIPNEQTSLEVPTFTLNPEFSVIMWVLMKSGNGLIISNRVSSQYFYLSSKNNELNGSIANAKTGAQCFNSHENLNYQNWNLIKVLFSAGKVFYRNLDTIEGYCDLEIGAVQKIKIGGIEGKLDSMHFIVWYFVVFRGDLSVDGLYSRDNGYCLNECCSMDQLNIIDEDYGIISLNSKFSDRIYEGAFDCSGKKKENRDFIENCNCENFCYYNVRTKEKTCFEADGIITSSEMCTPDSELTLKPPNCCPLKCSKCSNSNTCTSCSDPEGIVNSKGHCVCRKGYFGIVSSNFTTNCTECPESCSACDSLYKCTECHDQTNANPKKRCRCNDGYYLNSTDPKTCIPCDKFCSKCNEKICLKCNDTNAQIYGKTCKCIRGFFKANGEGPCTKCVDGCEECSDDGSCLKCSDQNARVNNGQCECMEQFYKEGFNCIACDGECRKCIEKGSCLECKSAYAIPFRSGCKCIDGHYNISRLNFLNSCKKCSLKCDGCEENGHCFNCIGKYTILTNFSCPCEPGYYDPGDAYQDCIKCISYQESETCKLQCEKKMVWVKNQCKNCSEFCNVCESPEKCLECEKGFIPRSGVCGCPQGKQLEKGKCVPKYFTLSISVQTNNSLILLFSEELETNLTVSTTFISTQSQDLYLNITSLSPDSYLIEVPTFKAQRNVSTPFILSFQEPIYSITDSTLEFYSYQGSFYPLGPSAFAKAIKSTTQSVLTASFASAMVSNPAACWILINTIQIISFLPLSAVNFSEDIIEFIQAIGGYSVIPNWIALFFNKDASGEPSDRAKILGVKSSVFWVNFGSSLLLLMAYIVFAPFIYLGMWVPKVYKYCENWIRNYKYNLFLRFWIEVYLEIGIFALIQIEAVLTM